MKPAAIDETMALVSAITALAPFHHEHAVPVLRRALVGLLATTDVANSEAQAGIDTDVDACVIHAPSRPSRPNGATTPAAITVAEWHTLRLLVRSELDVREISHAEFAKVVGLDNAHAVAFLLSKRDQTPSQTVLGKLRAWLAKSEATAAAAATFPRGDTANGAGADATV
jgi:hypothetical protein